MNYAEDGDEENAREGARDQFDQDFYDFRQETFLLIDFNCGKDQITDIIIEKILNSQP